MIAARTSDDPARNSSPWPWVYFIALAYLTLHMATSTRYGYFRDALYYLTCSEHLDFGYVDQPPLIVALAWLVRHTLGTSLPALLFWPALANKYSIVIFGFALLFGVLLTSQRKILFTPWILAGGGIALLIFLPNLIWNIQHHWPFIELMHNIRVTGKDVVLPLGAYLAQQILMMNPVTFPFWFGGLVFYFFSRHAKAYRAFAWAFVITVAIFLATHGKDYYAAPAYAMLLAAGGMVTERLLSSSLFSVRPKLTAATKWACFCWLIAGIALLLPLVLPVLTVDAFLRYQSHLPIDVPRTERSFVGAALPQYYADEFPWPGMVAAVARVYHALPPEEQTKTAIFCNNYGEAAAIDFFGPQYNLPKAISGHQNYFLWGPRSYTGEMVIYLLFI